MATTGFHSEWVTIGKHRILLECRCGYPDEELRFIARVTVATCDNNSAHDVRVVYIHNDDKNGVINIKIASDNPEDERLEELVRQVLHTLMNNGNCQPDVVIVKAGDKNSDRYDHMEHLSVQADVAVDRYRHSDEDYMHGVTPPH